MRKYREIMNDMYPFLKELSERSKIKMTLTVSEKEFDKFCLELKDKPIDETRKEVGSLEIIHDISLDKL